MNIVARSMKPGFDGHPTISESVRDPDGKGKRDEQYVETRYDSVGRLYKQRIIERHHWEAACALQIQAERAEIIAQPHPGGSKVSRSVFELSDAKMRALAAHADTRAAVTLAMGKAGSRGETLLRLIVIDNMTLHQAAQTMKIPERAISECLRFALDVLARHYELA